MSWREVILIKHLKQNMHWSLWFLYKILVLVCLRRYYSRLTKKSLYYWSILKVFKTSHEQHFFAVGCTIWGPFWSVFRGSLSCMYLFDTLYLFSEVEIWYYTLSYFYTSFNGVLTARRLHGCIIQWLVALSWCKSGVPGKIWVLETCLTPSIFLHHNELTGLGIWLALKLNQDCF